MIDPWEALVWEWLRRHHVRYAEDIDRMLEELES